MHRNLRTARRARLSEIDRHMQSNMRLSDLILAVSGVLLLGVFCLLILAGKGGNGDDLAGTPVQNSKSIYAQFRNA